MQFIELDAAQLPRALDDVDAVAITNSYAAAAGLKLSDAIFKEDNNSLYVNILVVREADMNNLKLQQLLSVFQSKAVIDKAEQLFGNGAVPGLISKAT